jgi:hypothetical protein
MRCPVTVKIDNESAEKESGCHYQHQCGASDKSTS